MELKPDPEQLRRWGDCSRIPAYFGIFNIKTIGGDYGAFYCGATYWRNFWIHALCSSELWG